MKWLTRRFTRKPAQDAAKALRLTELPPQDLGRVAGGGVGGSPELRVRAAANGYGGSPEL